MSEHQYYEFQAVDTLLTYEQQEELSRVSSRAKISASSFVNTYNYGDLKADSLDLMCEYFDAHV
jgi:hypothetical protein